MSNIEPEHSAPASILEFAIGGITETYLVKAISANRDSIEYASSINMHLTNLVRQGLLMELADKNRNNVAYKTTRQGIQHLLMTKSLRHNGSASPYAAVVVEA
jgi:hypothetical protein